MEWKNVIDLPSTRLEIVLIRIINNNFQLMDAGFYPKCFILSFSPYGFCLCMLLRISNNKSRKTSDLGLKMQCLKTMHDVQYYLFKRLTSPVNRKEKQNIFSRFDITTWENRLSMLCYSDIRINLFAMIWLNTISLIRFVSKDPILNPQNPRQGFTNPHPRIQIHAILKWLMDPLFVRPHWTASVNNTFYQIGATWEVNLKVFQESWHKPYQELLDQVKSFSGNTLRKQHIQ